MYYKNIFAGFSLFFLSLTIIQHATADWLNGISMSILHWSDGTLQIQGGHEVIANEGGDPFFTGYMEFDLQNIPFDPELIFTLHLADTGAGSVGTTIIRYYKGDGIITIDDYYSASLGILAQLDHDESSGGWTDIDVTDIVNECLAQGYNYLGFQFISLQGGDAYGFVDYWIRPELRSGIIYERSPITVSPAAVDFGGVDVGNSSSDIITISNSDLTDFTISSIQFENGGAGGAFTVTSPFPLILPQFLAPGDSLALEVTFAPATSGLLTDTLTIFGPSLTNALRVTLAGTGLSGDNQPPLAVACCNSIISTSLPASYSLDGGMSFDPDNHLPLTFSWEVVSKPEGSSVQINQSVGDPALPLLSPIDVEGEYLVRLIVTDSLGLASAPDQVAIRTYNTPPVCEAGSDQVLYQTPIPVALDGSQSWDAEGDLLTYSWEIIAKPVDSTALLDDPSSQTPTFVADVQGDYVIRLTVSDIFMAIGWDEVMVSYANIRPVADAGQNQSVAVGETVSLDGSGSSDENGDILTYEWSFVSLPEGSTAVIDDPFEMQSSFTPDLAGSYIVQLSVHDGELYSEPAQITIVATSSYGQAIERIDAAIEIVNEVDPDDFKNTNMQNVMVNKLAVVLTMIDKGFYQEALDKLETDLLRKTDGCISGGAPDKNDWIRDCEAQNQVYSAIIQVIAVLEAMLN